MAGRAASGHFTRETIAPRNQPAIVRRHQYGFLLSRRPVRLNYFSFVIKIPRVSSVKAKHHGQRDDTDAVQDEIAVGTL